MSLNNRTKRIEKVILNNVNYAPLVTISNLTDSAGGEIPKYYTLDEKGHVLFATTNEKGDASPEVQKIFTKAICFFAALTSALNKKGKTLFDYEAVNSIIAGSGWFLALGKEKRYYKSESTTTNVNTSIIQNVLGTNITGGGMAIAKNILASLGGQIQVSYEKSDTKKEIAHLLFICESIMGIPMISVSLYHTNLEQHSWAVNTNCASVSRSSISFNFDSDDYMFADPEFIAKFTPEFERSEAYDKLIDNLANLIS